MRTEAQKAYMAGFLDGEGNIRIATLNQKNGAIRHALQVTVTNTAIDALEELAREWGRFSMTRRHRREGWSEVADIKWNTASAIEMLKEIQPYLRLKAEQCRLALEFASLLNPVENKSRTISVENWKRREELRVAISKLNHREVAPLLPPDEQKPPLTCQWCGTEFTTYQKLRKYCSRACNQKAGMQAYMDRSVVQKTCPQCQTDFRTWRKNAIFCSSECQIKGRKRRTPKQ